MELFLKFYWCLTSISLSFKSVYVFVFFQSLWNPKWSFPDCLPSWMYFQFGQLDVPACILKKVNRFFLKIQKKTKNSIPHPGTSTDNKSDLRPEPTNGMLVLPTFITTIYSSPSLSTLHLPKLGECRYQFRNCHMPTFHLEKQRIRENKCFFLYNLYYCSNNIFSLLKKIKYSLRKRGK